MKSYDLYGFKERAEIEAARVASEKALKISFSTHESSYHSGDYYRSGNAGSENFILQRNYDDFEKEWAESRFKEHAVLLYVNESQRAKIVETALTTAGFELLRRENLY